ncbi:MAG TPA: asparaginase domain-containing protein [Alphaproteobacteria bacterium]
MLITMEMTFITTGGTIDGANSDTGALRDSSSAAEWLGHQAGLKINHIALMNKDSRQITDDDRMRIVQTVAGAKTDRILIGHGTFSICDTGRLLKKELPNTDKTILLVGAWIPFNNPSSDAENQMLFALERLHEGKPGIFVAMDQQLWNPDTTEKKMTGPNTYRLTTITS